MKASTKWTIFAFVELVFPVLITMLIVSPVKSASGVGGKFLYLVYVAGTMWMGREWPRAIGRYRMAIRLANEADEKERSSGDDHV